MIACSYHNESDVLITMYDPIINIAIEATRVASTIIARALKRLELIKIAEKRPNDMVTEVDLRVEEAIIAIIRKAYPSHGILSEECGEMAGESPDHYQWIIDPIDGTRNFIHGFPHFAISIAVAYKKKIEHAVIYDPTRQELFTATRGKGAQLNNMRIRVSERKRLHESLLGTGFSFRYQHPENQIPFHIFQTLMTQCGDIRRAGAATLDLAYVACGRLDGFWEIGLKPWDMAAGALLVKEAGGIVCDLEGGENHMQSGEIMAANPAMTRQILKNIRPCLKPA